MKKELKQKKYVFVNLYAFDVEQKLKPTDDGHFTLAVVASNPYNTIINTFPQNNSSLKFEITAKRLCAASQRVL